MRNDWMMGEGGRGHAVCSRGGLRRRGEGSLGGRPDEAFQRNVEFAVEAADHFQG